MRSKGWFWFFLVLILLTGLAVSTLVLYNRGQQLTPDELQAARRLWQAHGPRDYRLSYTRKENQQEPDYYIVRVRNDKIESATINGKAPPADQAARLDMEGLFHLLEEQLQQRAAPGQPRTFMRAIFDTEDGHLRWYVHAPRGGTRLEINVQSLQPLQDVR